MSEEITIKVVRGGSGREETKIIKKGIELYKEDWDELEKNGAVF